MTTLPTDATLLCLVVLLLGARHGFDADHLAAIDGMTRLQRHGRAGRARWCGALFSLGHGAVVMAVALAVSSLHGAWQAPAWVDIAGRCISIGFLLLLGIANGRALLATPAGQAVRPTGLRSDLLQRWVQRWHGGRSAWMVAGVGALFALSFDTLSQAAMLAVAGGSAAQALLLALLFTLGMLLTDAVNGWWLAGLLARTDALALRASRVMSWAVTVASLLVAALALTRLASEAVDGWAEQQGLLFGAVLVSLLALSYAAARLLAMVAPSHAGHTVHPV